MVFSKDDLAVIVTCFTEKGWIGTRIAKEFPNKKWSCWSINRILAKYRRTGTTDRKKGSVRPVTMMTDENLAEVEQLCQSQDDKPIQHIFCWSVDWLMITVMFWCSLRSVYTSDNINVRKWQSGLENDSPGKPVFYTFLIETNHLRRKIFHVKFLPCIVPFDWTESSAKLAFLGCSTLSQNSTEIHRKLQFSDLP